MLNYLVRRLFLLPWTLLCIILVNFVIINLAPGDPVTLTEISPEGMATRRTDATVAFGGDERYLQFREHYGLTLPILFNLWPWITQEDVDKDARILATKKSSSEDDKEMSVKDYDALRVDFGDRARYSMSQLLCVIQNENNPLNVRILASRFFARGGTRQAFLGSDLSQREMAANRKLTVDNELLRSWVLTCFDSAEVVNQKVVKMMTWFQNNAELYRFLPTSTQKIQIFFFETRFYRYMSRVLTLDFGTMRNDDNKTVISEVTRRFKYSLTLAIVPMLLTFVLCQIFGLVMAYYHNRWPDYQLSLIFLILYALPIFVVAPFLIEEVALNHHFPFTNIPIPLSGFTSPDRVYESQTSFQRLIDVLQHICLPIIAVIYGSLAAQTRLSRTAVLEVLRQDYVRTAHAKGVSPLNVMVKHVGRNASITIVTSIASSLGIVLAGSLIVETLFEINGFGKFFYDAIVNRDYNVIMFSSFAGSLLALVGYLVADIAYTVLDPRLTLE